MAEWYLTLFFRAIKMYDGAPCSCLIEATGSNWNLVPLLINFMNSFAEKYSSFYYKASVMHGLSPGTKF